MEYLKHPVTYVKAIWTAIITALAQLTLVLVDDMSFSDVTTAQWLVIVLGTMIATGGVFGFENKPIPPIEGRL